MWIHILTSLGLLTVLIKIVSILRLLASVFLFTGKSLSDFGGNGSWAIVTGASDGIGKEFALQFASYGFNVILVSRTHSKLSAVAAEIQTRHASVRTECIAVDFSKLQKQEHSSETGRSAAESGEAYAKLKAALKGKNVSVLINNVGCSHSIPVPFLETPEEEIRDIINVNCYATLLVTKLVAPVMVSQQRGLILTMASFGGVVPTPLLATYSGSKAFLQHWSSALASELEPSGVMVYLVQSHLVISAMSKIRKPSTMIPTPKAFVKAVLAKVGRTGGAQGIAATGSPYWSHALMLWALINITGTTNWLVINRNKAMHIKIRERALRKLEKDGKVLQSGKVKSP